MFLDGWQLIHIIATSDNISKNITKNVENNTRINENNAKNGGDITKNTQVDIEEVEIECPPTLVSTEPASLGLEVMGWIIAGKYVCTYVYMDICVCVYIFVWIYEYICVLQSYIPMYIPIYVDIYLTRLVGSGVGRWVGGSSRVHICRHMNLLIFFFFKYIFMKIDKHVYTYMLIFWRKDFFFVYKHFHGQNSYPFVVC